MRTRKVDKIFLFLILLLTFGGFFVFASASFKLLSEKSQDGFTDAIVNQFLLGVVGGLIIMAVVSRINYHRWKKSALWVFLASVAATLLVFIPGFGVEVGGARRWITLWSFSFQPSEFLKLGSLLFIAALLSSGREQVKTFSRGLIPVAIVLAVTGGILLSQPDTDTFGFIALAGLSMFIAAGGRWRHLFVAGIIGTVILVSLIETRPYLKERFSTFFQPTTADSLGPGYQIEQSLIAIGSGGFFGRGFGQSIQKFGFLPEPTTDSIFAVAAEEFGFLGSIIIIGLFVLFGLKGVAIARKTHDSFGKILTIGVTVLIVSQSFVNIAAMTGLVPLAGTPLLFVSHGGTALFFTLAACGIVLNISKSRRR